MTGLCVNCLSMVDVSAPHHCVPFTPRSNFELLVQEFVARAMRRKLIAERAKERRP